MEEIEMIRGDTFVFPHPIKINKNNESYQLQDGENIMFSLKRYSDDEEYVLQKSLNNGITWNSKLQRYIIRLEPEDTNNIDLYYESRLYQYDIVVILKGNLVKTIRGSLRIWKDITRNETTTKPSEDTELTEEQIKALDEMTFEINEDGELLISYDKEILEIDFYIENNDLIISQDIEVDFNINVDGEMEVSYERDI